MNTGFMLNTSLVTDINLALSFLIWLKEAMHKLEAPLLFRQKINLPCSNPFLSSHNFLILVASMTQII